MLAMEYADGGDLAQPHGAMMPWRKHMVQVEHLARPAWLLLNPLLTGCPLPVPCPAPEPESLVRCCPTTHHGPWRVAPTLHHVICRVCAVSS